jgi:hypothetical protein
MNMPIVFIHGVNARQGETYTRNVAQRKIWSHDIILQQLAREYPTWKSTDIIESYWGDFGVQFKWNLESLPHTELFEMMGTADVDGESADLLDFLFAESINELSDTTFTSLSKLSSFNEHSGYLIDAAHNNLILFLEAIFLPLFLAKHPSGDIKQTPEKEGLFQARLGMAIYNVATNSDIQNHIIGLADKELLDYLKDQILQQLIDQETTTPITPGIEILGPRSSGHSFDKINKTIESLIQFPTRFANNALLYKFRANLHKNIARFLGDILVYLNQRSDQEPYGPITSTVLNSIDTATKLYPDEKLIIVTHSLGGIILYDILTYYKPDLVVDAWISTGGQIGQFEEMKLFKASNPELKSPQKIALPPNIRRWLNIYNPLDVLSFITQPIFTGCIRDQKYVAGSSLFAAHMEYFQGPALYKIIYEYLIKEEVLR